MLSMIPWHAAFVGIPGNFFTKIVPGALVFLHLFAGKFLSIYKVFIDDILDTRQKITLVILAMGAIKVNL